MTVHVFGETEGLPIFEIEIQSATGAMARVITWGAAVRDLIVPTSEGSQRVVLGLNTLEDYERYSPHFGAIAGRFANRIARGRFTLDGRSYVLDRGPGSKHSLHGGGHGFGKRPWKLGEHGASSVTLTLRSPDGDAGYPGTLEATCLYRLDEPTTLHIELTATTDAPTVINLAHHSYFNLDGSADILDHFLTLHSGFYTPADDELIPTGEILSVSGTPFDFRAPRKVRDESGQVFDNDFVIARAPDPMTGLAHAATLRSSKNGLAMELHTTEPAVQFYDAAKLNVPVAGLGGASYGPHAGLCLEPQRYPDSPNRRHFTPAVLRPGETYRQVSEYRFVTGGIV